MALYKLDVFPLYRRAMGTPAPAKFFALSIGRWLLKVSGSLDDKGYCFEAGSAEELAETFKRQAELDGSPECLAMLWCELQDWGESSVTTISGREKALCEVPNLPDALSC